MTYLIIYLKCVIYLWLLLGFALYMDDPANKKRVRRHCAHWPTLAMKFAIAPITLCYVAYLVAIQPLKVLYRNYAIGCYSGRPTPMPMFGINNWEKIVEPPPSVSESIVRNGIARPSYPLTSTPMPQPPGVYDPERYPDGTSED